METIDKKYANISFQILSVASCRLYENKNCLPMCLPMWKTFGRLDLKMARSENEVDILETMPYLTGKITFTKSWRSL